MLYFKVISLLLGTSLLLFGIFYYVSPKEWVSFFANTLWAEVGPLVIMPLFLVHLILSLVGWFICLSSYKQPLGLLVSGLLTLGAVKLACILPIYSNFSKIMKLLVTTEKFACIVFSSGAIVMGVGFIFLGIVIH